MSCQHRCKGEKEQAHNIISNNTEINAEVKHTNMACLDKRYYFFICGMNDLTVGYLFISLDQSYSCKLFLKW